jgi:hypothetical protein
MPLISCDYIEVYNLLGFHSGVNEVSILLGCDALSLLLGS